MLYRRILTSESALGNGCEEMDCLKKNKRATVSAYCVSLALLTGCGSSLSQVSGVVTLDGEPLRGSEQIQGTVFFQPASGDGTSAAGLVDEQGNYFISSGSQEGVVPGEYVVTISATEIVPSKAPGGTPTGKRISDPKYASAKTSGLRFTVLEGSNEFDISIESPPSRRGRPRRR